MSGEPTELDDEGGGLTPFIDAGELFTLSQDGMDLRGEGDAGHVPGNGGPVLEEPQADEASSAVRHLFGRGLVFGLIYVAQSAMMIIVTPAIVRLLGSYQYGQVAVILTVGQVLIVLTGLGLQAGIHRHYAEEDGDTESRSLVTISIVLTLALTVAADVTGPYWAKPLGFPGYTEALRCGVWWAGLAAVGVNMAALLRSQDRLPSFLAVLGSQAMLSQVIALGLVLGVSRTALSYMEGLLIGQIIGVLVGLVFVHLNFRGLFNRRMLAACLVISLPLVPHGIALQILNLGDRVIVQRDLGSRQVGRYQVAYNAAAFPMVLLTILNTAWQPKIFEVTVDSRPTVLADSRDQLLRLLVPALAGAALIAPLALRLLAPTSFDLNGLLTVFALVTCSAIPYALYLANLRILLAYRRTGNMLWATPICAVLNIVLNIWLVPVLGINGSALATLLSFAALAVVTGIVGTRVCRLRRTPLSLWVAMLVAAGATFAFNEIPITVVGFTLRVLGVALCGAWIVWSLVRIGRGDTPEPGRFLGVRFRRRRPRRLHRIRK